MKSKKLPNILEMGSKKSIKMSTKHSGKKIAHVVCVSGSHWSLKDLKNENSRGAFQTAD